MNAIGTLLALVLLAPPSGSAALRTAQPVVAKGEIKGGPPLVQAFDLAHSAPDGVVTITGVEAGCGCLRQHLTATVLKPGESAKLTVEVNTLTQPDGPNRWPVRVRFRRDLPGTPQAETGELELLVSATVSREITLTPPQLALSAAGEVTRTITLTDRRPKPLNLLRAESSSPHLAVAIGARQGAEATVTLKLRADAPGGIRDETVVLYSDDPAYPEFRVPVRVQKREAGAATVVPEQVFLRFAAGETEGSSLVQVRSADGKPVGVESVTCEHPAVKVKWSAGRGPVATLRVTVTAATAGQADVRVRLAEPANPVVVVPVQWAVK